jgi:hypothetical protein
MVDERCVFETDFGGSTTATRVLRQAIVPVDAGLLVEHLLEGAEGGWEIAANGDDDVALGKCLGGGELAVEGICVRLVVRLVDL